jgi:hypothetical protein
MFFTIQKEICLKKECENMGRVSAGDRALFHEILDGAIDKMNEPKNEKKAHWHCMFNRELVELLIIEAFELRHAVYFGADKEIENECKDVINFGCMIADNAKAGRG